MVTARTHAVIVNYNSGAWLARSVAALLQGDLAGLTVIDNASDDDSIASLNPALRQRLRLIENHSNIGFGPAVNQALAEVEAEFFLVVNPDCEFDSRQLADLSPLLDQRPRIGIVGVLVLDLEGREQRACRRRLPTVKRSMVTLLGAERWFEGINVHCELPTQAQPVEAISGALLCIRASCFRELGGFDPDYFLHCEDLDLFARARAAAWEVWFHPDVHAVHAGGVSHRGDRKRAMAHKRDSMLRYYRNHMAQAHPRWLRWLWPLCIRARLRAALYLARGD